MPPIDFPVDKVPSSGLLPPMKLNKSLLKEALVTVHENVSSGKWSSKNGKSYLGYFCFKTSDINHIIDRAINCHNLTLSEETETDNSFYQYIAEDSKKYPLIYSMYSHSYLMDTRVDDLDCFPDAPMHLFSGYIKAVMSLMMLFLKRKSKYNTFLNVISCDKTMSYLESMKLQWLKVIPYSSDKFASYGCENYLGLCSVMKLQTLYLLQLEYDECEIFPNTPQSRWTYALNKNGYQLEV